MKPHVKIYYKENNLDVCDTPLCEIRADGCENMSVDIMHIEHRGMGGDKSKDVNENLVAGCRKCHDKHGAGLIANETLFEIARKRIERLGTNV